MKSKKTAPPRRRISFAVDRDEIEVNSDWVEAVMTSPSRPAAAPPPDASPVVSMRDLPANQSGLSEPSERAERAVDHPDKNISTGADSTPVEECSSVEMPAPVAEKTPVVQVVPVELIATAEELIRVGLNRAPVVNNAIGKAHINERREPRIMRPRLIVRVTDGLTPGQYAVYSLMYEAGEGGSLRIYSGGYADLRRLTGMSKRGIQNVVGQLQSKQVIRIHQKPGYHRTETSAYEVPDPQTVIGIWRSNGWNHALGKSKTLTS